MPKWRTTVRCLDCGRTYVQISTDKLYAQLLKQSRKGMCSRCVKKIGAMLDFGFGS